MPYVNLITGAAGGIGAAVARRRAQPGTTLFLLDRDAAGLDAVASECAASGARAECRVVDFATNGWEIEVEHALKRLGRVDVLVNNAGVATENEPDDIAGWQRVLAINLDTPFRLTAACLPWMTSGGRIVNVSSILGRAGKLRNTAYCASKHGLIGYTKALALDLAPRGITANAVLPGWVDTPMLRRELAAQADAIGASPEQLLRNARRQLPIKRFVGEDEVAAMVDYLASPEAAGVTAQSLVIDGGYTCGM
ncbi:MAG TPA: SDR family oxidoreductase [Chitinolyticbacter sp.]|nr:SDR family oxidoreductase [Chitinolyticbacter sp.]